MNIRKRTNALLADAEVLYREKYKDRIGYIQSKYMEKEQKKKFRKVFQDLFFTSRSSGKKAASLGICCLNSSVLTRTYEFLLVLFGEEFYLDEQPVGVFWKPDYFFDNLEDDMASILRRLSEKYCRICRFEESAVLNLCVEYINTAFYTLCNDWLGEIINEKNFESMDKTEEFFIFYGRYRGEAEVLYKQVQSIGGCGSDL